MPRLTPEQRMEALDRLKLDEKQPSDMEYLQRAIQDKHNHVVAKAAKLCREHFLYQYCEAFIDRFEYFAAHPEKDKGCYAKKAIVQTLYELDHLDNPFYQNAITIRQPEPVWGGHVDTAVEVRCWAALGLTLSHDSRIVFTLLPLLHDSEAQARLGAIKAISCLPSNTAELLLREKVYDGDEDAFVIGECLHQLMQIEAEHSLPFVESLISPDSEDNIDEEVFEYAAITLAQCNTPQALLALMEAFTSFATDNRKQGHIIKALSLHRASGAHEFLIEQIGSVGKYQAGVIISALALHKANSSVVSSIEQRLSQLGDAKLLAIFNEQFQVAST